MVSSYKLLEHTADIGFEVRGNDLKSTIEAATEALYNVMVISREINCSITQKVEIEAIDKEAVIIKWLNEVLFLFDSYSFIAGKIEIEKVEEDSNGAKITGTLHGEIFNPKLHEFKTHVKAVTFHQFEILETKQEITLKVFLDL